jgi:peptidoglycan/xylan/chitin deacetylase (PgdA/CDA1 family)
VDDLCELEALGMTLGVHGLDHRPMTGMENDELVQQTSGARQLLQELTGAAARSFAFPGGRFDHRAQAAVKAAGFDLAFASRPGAGRYAVPRVVVEGSDTPLTLTLKLSRAYAKVLGRAPDSHVGRLVRAAGSVVRHTP